MEFCSVYHEIKAPTNRQYGKPEITGKIVFTPDLQKGEVWTDDGVVVPALPITCHVIDGKMYDKNGEYPSRYVNLMAGGPTANPSSMHWRVSYHDMRVGNEHFYIEPFVFKAIPYVKVNLADVTPVAGYTPPGIIRGGTGSPGLGIIFKGVVLAHKDLPVDGVEDNHAYAITTTKELAVWHGDGWLFVPNFAGIDVDLEDISDWHYEARKNVEFSRAQLEEMKELRALAEKYAESGYDYMKMSMASADGKSSIFYGSDEPESPKEGDTWFKDTADGSVIIMQYVDGTWVAQVDVDAMDKRLKENERIINVELKDALADLDEQLKNLDAVTALEVVDKLATLETKLAEADVALKQELQGELAALDEALSGDLTTKLAGLKGDLEAADAARAEAVATAFVQLENRLKAADKAVKDDLVAQLADLESDLAALDTSVGENLTAKLSALRTELLNADTAVNDELVGKLATLKTQLQNADTALTSTLRGELATLKTQLQNADEAVTTDLATRLENVRKTLADASDTIAEDLAEVDSVVSRQRPGNLFPDPFFADSSWTGGAHVAEDGIFKLKASGVQTGRYYQPVGLRDSSIQFERGASYLMTADVRFGSTSGIDYVNVYARVPNSDGTGLQTPLIGRLNRVTVGPNKNSYTWAPTSAVLTLPDNMSSGTGTIGFFVENTHPDGDAWITNVRLVRAADNSLIIDGAVTAAKVQAGVIEADHIASGAVEAEKLAADSVVAGKIATNAVVAKNIKAEQITTAKLAADAVTAVKIAADAILARNIKAGQITSAKIAADAVTANEIASETILAGNIKAGQITTAKIATNAVTANEIASETILATNIKANAITTSKIATNAVTANEIAADTILAGNIKAGQITTDKIGANQITSAKIAAGAVTANELQAENATINKLWTNGIAAKSIVTNRILVANNGNMLPEISSYMGSTYPDPDPYSAFGKNSGHPSMWLKGRVNATIDHALNLVEGQRYKFSYSAMASVDGTRHYISMHKGSADGKYSPTETFRNYIGNNTRTSPYVVTNEVINESWKKFEIEFTPETSGFAYLYIFANHTNGTDNPNYQWFKDVSVQKMTGSTLIEDGAITTGKVASNAITANEIAADQVLAKHVKSDQILAKHVKAGEIQAKHLLAEEATIDKLWTNGLVAKTVQTASLSVGPANLYRDPALLDANSFDSRRSDTGGYGGGGSVTIQPSTSQVGAYDTLSSSRGRPTRLIPGVRYYISVMVRVDRLVVADRISLYLRAYPNENASGSIGWASPSKITNDTTLSAGTWNKVEGTFVMPEGLEYLVLGFYVESASSAQAVFSDPLIVRQYSSTMIQDGAITTGKVAANAITANEIKAGEVKAKHINSGEITSDKLTVENGFIKNAMIGDGEITNAKIGNLDASKITAGYLNANRIKSGSIKTAHIGANQITTNEIAAGAIKADQIDANAITGDKLKVGTIKADRIEAKVFTQVATSVLPLIPGTVDPTWTDGLRYVARSGTKDAALPAGIPGYYRDPSGTIAAGATKSVTNTYNNVVSIDPNLEYEATWWVRSSAGSPRFIYVTLEDQNGNTDIVQRVDGTDKDGNDYSQHTWGNPIRVIITSASTTWKKYKTLFTFKEGTKSIRIHNVYFDNSTNSSAAYLYIAGLEISPSIAKKSDVDAIQDKQIKDNKKRLDEIGALSKELDRRSVGMVPVKADKLARSTTHGAGVAMPSYDRYTNLYLSPSFTGTVAFQVFYEYSTFNNRVGQSFQWFFDHTEFKLQPASNLNSYFAPLAEGGNILHLQFRVPEGSVDQALLLVDHLEWDRG